MPFRVSETCQVALCFYGLCCNAESEKQGDCDPLLCCGEDSGLLVLQREALLLLPLCTFCLPGEWQLLQGEKLKSCSSTSASAQAALAL